MPPQRRLLSSKLLAKKHYSSAKFASKIRLNAIQNILSDGSFDCMICIQGVDSRYNEGMQDCINFLLLGLFENHRQQLISTGVEDEVIDDLIICVKTNNVDVYCNPINYTVLLPYIASWPSMHLHCLSEYEYENDSDAAEEFKIKSFVSMLSDCKSICVPFFATSHQNHVAEFDHMKIEHWPIIQAYALEGYGRGTFFTLQHDVSDVSKQLSEVYDIFDAVKTEQFFIEQIPSFERQWDCVTKNVEVACLSNFSPGFTETHAAEPLVTFFNHGRVGSSVSGNKDTSQDIWCRPFVYMGLNTKLLLAGKEPNEVLDIKSAGIEQTQALHMVCHCTAPRSGLVCTRTYFFDCSSLPAPVGDENEYQSLDTEQLSKAYRVAVEVTLKSIKKYSTTLNAQQVIDDARSHVVSSLQKSIDHRRLKISVELKIKQKDGSFKPVAGNNKAPKNVMCFSVTITGIYSHTNQKLMIGGIAFAESFLISTIRYGEGGENCDGQFLLLTENIPRWATWNVSDRGLMLCRRVENLVTNTTTELNNLCGVQLIDGQTIDLFSPQEWLEPISCIIYLYDQCVILLNQSLGPITLTKENIKSASYYDGGGSSSPAFLIFYTSLDFQTRIPLQLQNTTRMLVISLYPRTKAYKQFQENVFPVWKKHEDDTFVLKMEETLPECLQSMHQAAAERFEKQITKSFSKSPKINSSPPSNNLLMKHHHQFLNHLAISSCLKTEQELSNSDLAVLLDQREPLDPVEDNSIMLLISIISGVPGSYKDNVADYITKLTQERSRWVIHRQTPETSHFFDTAKLEHTLSYIYNILKKKSSSGVKASRMLIITPGHTDIQSVVSTITNHPNKELRQYIKIGSVTTCIDPHNTYMSGYCTIPGLLEQCAQGWVNNIVLTSSTDHGNRNFTRVQELIRTVNPTVSFIITDRGEITRSQDIELILTDTAFTQPNMIRDRILNSDSKSRGESFGLNTVLQKLTQPLVKSKLVSKLKALHESQMKRDSETVILSVCGRTQFVGSEEAIDVTYATVSNSLRVSPAQIKSGETTPTFFMSFTGLNVTETEISQLLHSCVQPKPQKKEYLSVDSLSEAIKTSIQKEKHLEPLPAGWFYNGSQYVDMTGERLSRHPEFDRFLQEYVNKENEKIQLFNQNINND